MKKTIMLTNTIAGFCDKNKVNTQPVETAMFSVIAVQQNKSI